MARERLFKFRENNHFSHILSDTFTLQFTVGNFTVGVSFSVSFISLNPSSVLTQVSGLMFSVSVSVNTGVKMNCFV